MTGKALWQKLKTLVACDQQIHELEQKIDEAKKIIVNNRLLMTGLEASIEEKKHRCAEEKKNVKLEELQANVFKEKEEAKRKLLDRITNPKEYSSLKKELDLIVRQRDEQEDVLLSSWHHLEQANKQLELEIVTNKKRITELEEEIATLQKSQEDLHVKLTEFKQQRETFTVEIPEEWLTRYDRMKHSVPNPIVPVAGESCSACFYAVLKQDFSRLKKAGVLACRNCYRFLYYDAVEEQESHQARF